MYARLKVVIYFLKYVTYFAKICKSYVKKSQKGAVKLENGVHNEKCVIFVEKL